MSLEHGVKTTQVPTSIGTPVVAKTGITFAVGTAPVHLVGGKVNYPIMCNSYAEAVEQLGYSDDWGKYSLCEVIYSHFKLFQTSPVFFVNVLDPSVHKTSVANQVVEIVDNRVVGPLTVIKESVVVVGYEYGTDYELFYNDENIVLEVLAGGNIPTNTVTLTVSCDLIDPTQVDKSDIIGGFNVVTKETTGFELIDSVFPKYGIIPDLLLAPGWSQDAEVATIMAAKSLNINGMFSAKVLCDVDTTEVTHYSEVPNWKNENNFNSPQQLLFYPMGKISDKVFHLSTLAAGLIANVDTNNGGCPSESPSNKSLPITSTVLADGTEVLMDVETSNYLNSNGVITAHNFISKFVLWGNYSTCYPLNTDVKDYFYCISRTFSWVANTLILTNWSKVDKKLNRRLIDSIVDSTNIWLNGLTAEEKILGGRIEYKQEDNTAETLLSGKAIFRIYMASPTPAQELEFRLEYDINYLNALVA